MSKGLPEDRPAVENTEQKARHGLIRESGRLSALTMVSRVLGLLRESTRANLLGTTVLGESFAVAFTTPNLFRRLLAEGVMSTALIPTIKASFETEDETSTRAFLSAAFSALMAVTLLVVALGMAGSLQITLLYGSMKRDASVVQDIAETAFLIRLMFPYLALVSAAAFLQGILNARGEFLVPGYGPIAFNLSFLLIPPLLVFWIPNPARAMALGVLVGGTLQMLCQLPALLRMGVRFKPVGLRTAFGHPGVRKVLALMVPTLIGMAAYELNSFVSMGLAYGVKATVNLQFSIRLQELILGVFIVSVSTVMLPELSGLAARKDWRAFGQQLERSLEVVILLTVPIAFFSVLQRVNIVAILFQSGQFKADDVAATATIFLYHTLGLLFIALNRILMPVFYACGDTKKPAWAGIAAFAVNIICAWLLSGSMGGNGIALALSLASLVNTLLLVWFLRGKPVPEKRRLASRVLAYILRLGLLSLVVSLPVWYVGRLAQAWSSRFESRFLFAGIPLLASAALFFGLGVLSLRLIRDPVAASLVQAFTRKRRSG